MRQNVFFYDHSGGHYYGADGANDANDANGADDADGGGDDNGDSLNELALCNLREMFQVQCVFTKSIHKQLLRLEIIKCCSSSPEVTTEKAQKKKKIQDHVMESWAYMIN